MVNAQEGGRRRLHKKCRWSAAKAGCHRLPQWSAKVRSLAARRRAVLIFSMAKLHAHSLDHCRRQGWQGGGDAAAQTPAACTPGLASTQQRARIRRRHARLGAGLGRLCRALRLAPTVLSATQAGCYRQKNVCEQATRRGSLPLQTGTTTQETHAFAFCARCSCRSVLTLQDTTRARRSTHRRWLLGCL